MPLVKRKIYQMETQLKEKFGFKRRYIRGWFTLKKWCLKESVKSCRKKVYMSRKKERAHKYYMNECTGQQTKTNISLLNRLKPSVSMNLAVNLATMSVK